MNIRSERIEIHFPPELKILAERAALVSGYTLTEYLAELVRKDAPERLKLQGEIQLTNELFDQFIQACERATSPGKTILNAARRLGEEGFSTRGIIQILPPESARTSAPLDSH